jgi:hypothetical protein
MRAVDLDGGSVAEFGSHGLHMIEAARLKRVEEFRVHVASCAPGSALGRHPTRLWQLFVVISGAGWVAGQDGVRFPIEAGGAVLWSPGEEHESGSEMGMTVVIVQSDQPPPTGA